MAISNIRTVGGGADVSSVNLELADGSGNNRVVYGVVTHARNPPNRTGATYNGVSGTLAYSIQPATSEWIGFYYWLDADLPSAAGTYSLVSQGGGTITLSISGFSCSGAAQSAPSDTDYYWHATAGTAPSVSLTFPTGGAVICGLLTGNGGAPTITGGQIAILASTADGTYYHAAGYDTSDGTVSYSHSVATSLLAAIAIDAAAATPTLTDVDTDETIVPGQTGVVATGTNLSAGASARWVDANANVLTMTNYSASATAPTFDVPNLATTLAAGVKFGSGTFEILDGGSVSVATLAVALDAPSGWQVHDVTDISQAADEGCLYYGLSPAVVVGDQILLSDTVTIDSQGFLEFPPGVTSINYYVFDETDDTWGTMGTFSVIVSNDGYAVKSTVRDAVRSVVRNILN